MAVKKDELLEDIVDARMCDINSFYEELENELKNIGQDESVFLVILYSISLTYNIISVSIQFESLFIKSYCDPLVPLPNIEYIIQSYIDDLPVEFLANIA